MSSIRHKSAPKLTDQAPEEVICITYCASFYDYEECKRVCLTTSQKNVSLFRRALQQAEADGLNEQHQHIFAAGAVWGWAKSKTG